MSSANRTGQEAAQTASEARLQLADSVEVYLEGGFRPVKGTAALPSTIVDATSEPFRVVRQGAISLERLREVVPSVLGVDEPVPSVAPAAETAAAAQEKPVSEAATAQDAPVEVTEAPAVEDPAPAVSASAPDAPREAKPE
ncbi:hypothetical protein StoSoilB13_13260 [Arthrobacter sp. StoSoilB13]|nr:hypothetical protein StoSoilB13_13260 [Arthrobacter sp. StoSoilB13]